MRVQVHSDNPRGLDCLLRRDGALGAVMTYEPKFWEPDDGDFDIVVEKARALVDDALEAAFEPAKDVMLKIIDKNVQEAVEDHVKEGMFWVVYEEKIPRIEFVAFLGEGDKDYPSLSIGLRELFQDALDNCDEKEDEIIWKALIKAYDDWKAD